PNSGELLALASRQAAGGGAPSASTLTDPFEPGSTAKLFTAAALLMRGRVESSDAVSGENGVWNMPVTSTGQTRRISDAHAQRGTLTLARAIQVTSNIAMAKFSSRLRPEEQFEMLRDFGFGTPTGAEFPGESRGILAFPDRWQPMYTRASVAMGYEFGVTPVQLAAAYAAIANDGVLLAPTLVREVRDPAGNLLYRHRPEPVRRVVTSEIAAQLREFLREAAGAGGGHAALPPPDAEHRGQAGTRRGRALNPRGGARAAPARIPGQSPGARASAADGSRGGGERAAGVGGAGGDGVSGTLSWEAR